LVSNAPVCLSIDPLNSGNAAFSQSLGTKNLPSVFRDKPGDCTVWFRSRPTYMTCLLAASARFLLHSGSRMMFQTPQSTRREPKGLPVQGGAEYRNSSTARPRIGQRAECNFYREVVEIRKIPHRFKKIEYEKQFKKYFVRVALVLRRMRKRYRHHSLRQCDRLYSFVKRVTVVHSWHLHRAAIDRLEDRANGSSCVLKQYGKSMWLKRGIPTGPIVSNVS
jgi:hypothetical protein